MFWTVFKFELAYWFKRPLTLLFGALFFLMAFFATASDAFLGIATGQIHGGRAPWWRDGRNPITVSASFSQRIAPVAPGVRRQAPASVAV